MRRTRFLPALLALLFTACNENLIDTQLSEEKGEVVISLSADERVEIVSARSVADDALPSLEDFRIEIVNSENVKFYREAYDPEETLLMNAGEYTLMAKYGDSLGFGFNAPFYMAKKQFTVEQGHKAKVEAVAKLANVRMAVNYGVEINADYQDFYTVIRNEEADAYVRFNDDEQRYGYIPGGKLSVIVYAPVDGELKCYTLKDENGDPLLIDAKPNDFITFNVNTSVNYGSINIGIKIDNDVTVENKDFTVPADAVSESKPRIALSSFDSDGNYYVREGSEVEADDVSFTFKAYSGMKSCVLEVDNDYMEGLGIPSAIDFAAQTPEQIEALEDKGFFWQYYGGIGVIDLADFIPGIAKNAEYKGKNVATATFKLTVTDEFGATVTKTARVLVTPDVDAEITIADYDIWANRLADATVLLTRGDSRKAKVQISQDQQNWFDVKAMDSNPFHLNGVSGLKPSATYYLRVLYDDWAPVSEAVSFTTESAAQLGNSGFEDYHMVQSTFTPLGNVIIGNIGGDPYTRNWYQPYAMGEADPWWACNSMQSMPDGHTGWTSTWCKNFPSSGYVKDAHSGSKAALLYCVNVGDGNTDATAVGTTYEGEIWIGTSDGEGNIATEGHAFTSRPSKLAFWYKYSPKKNQTFFVDAWVKAADGTVLATAQTTNGGAAESWTKHEMAFNYTVFNKKAATIYVRISSSYGDGAVNTGEDFDLGEETVTAHAGCFLKIDDMELVY